jgi:uncharacterized protein
MKTKEMKTKEMKTKPLTFLLSLTFLFLFSGSSVVFGGDYYDGSQANRKKDYKTAYKLWLPLAEQGGNKASCSEGVACKMAQFNVGTMYYKGRGVPQDYKEAGKWYRLFTEQGGVTKGFGAKDAHNKLGLMSLKGQGVPQDYKEAGKWFRLAADEGHSYAQYYLGNLYYDGTGVPQDYKEAVRLFRLSAEQENNRAQIFLGVVYSKGQGVPQDYVLAHMWANLGASYGDKGAVKNRDLIAKQMTPSQIEEAQRMARNWKPTSK